MNIPMINPVTITDPLTQSNCYILIEPPYALIIDPNDATAIISYLQSHQVVPEFIILTHEHCDHMAGLNELRKKYDFSVIASKKCSDGIQSTKMNMTRMMETYLYFKSDGKLRVTYPRFVCDPADITFDSLYIFTWQKHTFLFTRIPGHTPGSTCIIVDDSVLFSGDYFIPGEEVITRLPGGDDAAYQTTGKGLLRKLPTPILTYPGHGAPFTLTDEVKCNYGL